MYAEKRTIIKANFEGKVNTLAITEESIRLMQGDDEVTLHFDSNVNLQNFINLLMLCMHQKFQKSTADTEYGRSAYTYDYEVLNQPDLIANLRALISQVGTGITID